VQQQHTTYAEINRATHRKAYPHQNSDEVFTLLQCNINLQNNNAYNHINSWIDMDKCKDICVFECRVLERTSPDERLALQPGITKPRNGNNSVCIALASICVYGYVRLCVSTYIYAYIYYAYIHEYTRTHEHTHNRHAHHIYIHIYVYT